MNTYGGRSVYLLRPPPVDGRERPKPHTKKRPRCCKRPLAVGICRLRAGLMTVHDMHPLSTDRQDCDAQEYKMHNADVLFKEDSTVDDLIDVIEVRHPSGLNIAGVQAATTDAGTIWAHLNNTSSSFSICH